MSHRNSLLVVVVCDESIVHRGKLRYFLRRFLEALCALSIAIKGFLGSAVLRFGVTQAGEKGEHSL